MRPVTLAWGTALSVLVGFPAGVPGAHAQDSEMTLPAGSMEWRYECPAGLQCPTTCTAKGNPIFSTADYASVTIFRLATQAYWFRIDTGDKLIEFILEGEMSCSINGAKLKSARPWDKRQ